MFFKTDKVLHYSDLQVKNECPFKAIKDLIGVFPTDNTGLMILKKALSNLAMEGGD